jgi:hypothetical protein
VKAEELVKHNIDALLKARGQLRKDLAQWMRKDEAWLSQIMNGSPDPESGRPARAFRLKYLDRIADFFGLATYQLFQPGISPFTERRAGRERRTGLDRRVSNRTAQLRPQHTPDMETVTPDERALLDRIRRMRDAEDRKQLHYLIDRALLAQDAAPSTAERSDPPGEATPPRGPAHRTQKKRA